MWMMHSVNPVLRDGILHKTHISRLLAPFWAAAGLLPSTQKCRAWVCVARQEEVPLPSVMVLVLVAHSLLSHRLFV